jgi:hypothetical protein
MVSRLVDRTRALLFSQEQLRERWMESEYDAFRAESRRRIFLSIAVFCHQNQPIDGYYFEFGCHKARTMRMAWDAFHVIHDWRYVAFDSFEGLPEVADIDRSPIWKKGDLKTTEREFVHALVKYGMPRRKLATVKGFYSESLTDELKERLLPHQAAVVYIDCDLYKSASCVLHFVKDFLQRGTVIVFDDWFCFCGDPEKGERRAFREFLEQNPDLLFQDFIQTNEAKAFIFLGRRDSGNS